MIETIVEYQTHDFTNNLNNQPDNFPQVWDEMLDRPSCSVELSVESFTLLMLILIILMD